MSHLEDLKKCKRLYFRKPASPSREERGADYLQTFKLQYHDDTGTWNILKFIGFNFYASDFRTEQYLQELYDLTLEELSSALMSEDFEFGTFFDDLFVFFDLEGYYA